MNDIQQDMPVLRPGRDAKEFFLLVVLTIGLFLSILFVPLAGFFSSLFTPAPTALALVRKGTPRGWIVPGCSAALGAVILLALGLPESVPYLFALIGMGVIIGYGFARGWSVAKLVGLASLLVVGIAALLALVAYFQTRGQMVHLIEQDLRNVLTAALKQLGKGSPAVSPETQKNLLEMVPLVVRIMPGILISCTLVISWANLLVCRKYCRQAEGQAPEVEKLSLWKSPEHLVWLAIAGGLMLLLPLKGLDLLGINVVLVMGTVYFFQGLAIVAFYFEKWKVPLFVKGFVYAVFFLQRIASMAVAALGLFDVWFDFRKLNRQA